MVIREKEQITFVIPSILYSFGEQPRYRERPSLDGGYSRLLGTWHSFPSTDQVFSWRVLAHQSGISAVRPASASFEAVYGLTVTYHLRPTHLDVSFLFFSIYTELIYSMLSDYVPDWRNFHNDV